MSRSRIAMLTAAAAAVVMLAFGAGMASATSGAHFFSASGSVADNGALQVSWDEAGVGNNTVNYTLSAQSSATYACINGGGNHPKAANKQSVNGPLTSPSGQTFVLACVSYTDITLTDTTNNVSTSIADVSRTFVNITGC